MLLLLPSITLRIRIHVRRRGLSCAHTGKPALCVTGCTAVNATGPLALGATGRLALETSGLLALSTSGRLDLRTLVPQALGTIGPLALDTEKRTATWSAGGKTVADVDCNRDVSVSSECERKIPARVTAGNATLKMISEGSLDQSAARVARLRAFAPVAPEESSGKSANCSKSRRSSQLEKLRPSRAASVRAKASRSARNDTLVWVLPRARTPWRLFVFGVLTPHHQRNLLNPQYKNAAK